ncbi:hypothetical protein [Limnohabitans sp.]
MPKRWINAAVTVMAIAVTMLTACTQLPTEKQGVADMRPQIAFRYERPEMAQALVSVNGINMGSVASYRDSVASLKLVPGTHHLQVTLSGTLLLDERFYIADGVNKTFVLR